MTEDGGSVVSLSVDGEDYLLLTPYAETDAIQRFLHEHRVPYEERMLRAIAGTVDADGVVVDVGANVGNHSIYLAVATGCRVVAYEPQGDLASAIVGSSRLNGLEERVEVRTVGVGKAPALARLGHVDPTNTGTTHLELAADGGLVVVRLDDEELPGPVAAVKIDVEGMELDVLKGAAALIARERPELFVECQERRDLDAVAAWMRAHHYVFAGTYNDTPTHHFRPLAVGRETPGLDEPALALVRERYALVAAIRRERARRDRGGAARSPSPVEATPSDGQGGPVRADAGAGRPARAPRSPGGLIGRVLRRSADRPAPPSDVVAQDATVGGPVTLDPLPRAAAATAPEEVRRRGQRFAAVLGSTGGLHVVVVGRESSVDMTTGLFAPVDEVTWVDPDEGPAAIERLGEGGRPTDVVVRLRDGRPGDPTGMDADQARDQLLAWCSDNHVVSIWVGRDPDDDPRGWLRSAAGFDVVLTRAPKHAGLLCCELGHHRVSAVPDHAESPLRELVTRLAAEDAPPPAPRSLASATASSPASRRLQVAARPRWLEIRSRLSGDKQAVVWHEAVPRDTWEGDVHARAVVLGDVATDLTARFLDADGSTLATWRGAANADHRLVAPPRTHHVQLGLRVTGSGRGVARVVVDRWPAPRTEPVSAHDVLALVHQYPTGSAPQPNAFVHARLLQYRRRAGVGVDVFRLRPDLEPGHEVHEGIDVTTGTTVDLEGVLAEGRYTTIVVHFLNPEMWSVLRDLDRSVRILVWVHGSDVQRWQRRAFAYEDFATLRAARQASSRRESMWSEVHAATADRSIELVYVSEHLAVESAADHHPAPRPARVRVIHNPIDTDVFEYREKSPDQRLKILSVRSYGSRIYANDLAVATVVRLSSEPWFDELTFRFYGAGKLFEDTVAPLRAFDNVEITETFLERHELAALYRSHGVVLIPTRMDSHGVSRDEAMACGMVPISTAVAAVPEFVDHGTEGFLVEPEDVAGLAQAVARLRESPAEFARMSAAAAARVRRQSAADLVIPHELALLTTPS